MRNLLRHATQAGLATRRHLAGRALPLPTKERDNTNDKNEGLYGPRVPSGKGNGRFSELLTG